MAVLSPVAKQYFPNESGGPAAGYLLYTYATGTSTPQATYSNKAGTSANTNPIVLDARGEATIYLTPGTVYDYVLKTAEGVTVWTRTGVSSDEREYVSITDFGGQATPGFNNSPALALAVAEAIATGKGVEYPPGVFEHATGVTLSQLIPIKTAGRSRTWLKCDDTALFSVANSTIAAHVDWTGGCRFTGPGSATAGSCLIHFTDTSAGASFCNWQDITAGGVEALMISDAPAVAGSPGLRGVIAWCTWRDCNLRGDAKHLLKFNQGTGTGNCIIGGKPSISVAGGSVVEASGTGCNVGDFFFNGVHCISETGEATGAHTTAVFGGGADTTYRSRIGFYGGQIDAEMHTPFRLSSTGSTAWNNIRLSPDNNIGGSVNIYDGMPALARSVVDDQGVSCHRSQFNKTIAAGAGAITDDLFEVALGTSTGCEVKIVTSGVMGSEGSFIRVRRWLLRRGTDVATISSIEDNISGSVVPGLTITPTSDANGIVTFALSYTAPATDSTVLDFQLIATGGTIKVQNGRHL